MQTKGRNYFWGRSLLISFIGIMIVQDTKWNICIATLKKRMLFQIIFCPIVTFIWSKKCIELMNNSTSFTLKRGKEIWDHAKSKKKFSVRVVLQGGGGVVFIEEGKKIYGFPSESTTRI